MSGGRKLHKYDDYLQKIKLFAEASHIKITYKPLGSDGEWAPAHRKINLDDSLENSHEIAALLHEIGHAQDDTLLDNKYYAKLSDAYAAVYARDPKKKQLKLVIECEERAWKFAEGIAKTLKIPLGHWFYSYKEACIKDYKEEE